MLARLPTLWKKTAQHMEPWVFFPAASVVLGFVIFGAGFSQQAETAFRAVQTFITTYLGWFYIVAATGLVVFIAYLLFSRLGAIKLGRPEDGPEFSTVTWFTMMLSAGMGIGIVFFGVAEPLEHYLYPPQETQSAQEAMRWTFFHWGIHPWAIYSAIALPLAYFHFRYGLPLAPRSMLYPLLGDRIHGWVGHAVDVVCTVGTLFGVATSLGLGATQINAGLVRLFDVADDTTTELIIVGSITAAATISVVSGLRVGIRRLSEVNLALFVLLLVFTLVTGPTLYQIELFVSSLGRYVQYLPETSLHVMLGEKSRWQADWTLFYWSWWISWSPFVGIFVARISRGRTIREFIAAALLVPSLLGFLWFAVIGGTALERESKSMGFAERALQNTSLSLFDVLQTLPLARVSSVLAVVLIIIFFITSSDSGSLVDDMVTSGGDPDPPRAQRVFWAVSEGAVAATLLLSGGLQALRTASLTTGVPVALLLITACVGLWRALRRDIREEGAVESERLHG